MRDVLITVNGCQKDAAGEENCIELVTVGRYHHRGGVDYVTYRETELSGMEGTTTLLKIYPGRMVLIRTGAIEQQQEFMPGQRTAGVYSADFGQLAMSVITRCLTASLAESGGEIHLEYELEIEGQWQSTNTLAVAIREEQAHGH